MGRNISLDLLKLLMAFMIVGLHAGFLSEFSKLGEYLSVNGFFRIAVPVFFIINGFYFYSVLLNNAQLLWLKKIIILYLIWMAFYSFFWFSIPEMSVVGILNLIIQFLVGYHHLWYISGMLGAAIVVMSLHTLGTKFIIICIGITFIVGVLIQYAGNYHVLSGTLLDKVFNFNSIHRNFLFFSFPFFCIGFLINKHSIQKAISVKVALLATVLGICLLFIESYANFVQPQRDGGFDNFLSLILVCPAIFILFLNQSVSGNNKNIALYSSAIYFIHSFVLSVLRKFTEFEGTTLTITAIIISAIASIFIINLNKRINFIL